MDARYDFTPQQWQGIRYVMQQHSPDFWACFKEATHRAVLWNCWQAELYGFEITENNHRYLEIMKQSGLWHALNNPMPYIRQMNRQQHPQRSKYRLN